MSNINPATTEPNSQDTVNDNDIQISFADSIEPSIIEQYYDIQAIEHILVTTLRHMDEQTQTGLSYPYFAGLEPTLWQQKSKELALYITDKDEGRQLNLEARGKDYATNILSYPSELPEFLLEQMPTLPLGELIVCQAVLEAEAHEQGKSVSDHLTHLLVHGILHLLGFDHELGQAEQDEMEGFEIAILAKLGVDNPY